MKWNPSWGLLFGSCASESFFITPNSFPPVINTFSQTQLTFKWEFDSCAGGTPLGTALVGPNCVVDGNVVRQNYAETFPTGFDVVGLRSGKGNNFF